MAAHGGDAADLADAGLADDDGAGVHHGGELGGPRDILAGRGDGAGGADAGEAGMVLRRPDGFLEPVEVVRAQAFRHGDGLVDGPGAIGVEHEADLRTDRGAGGADRGFVDLVQLEVAHAGAQRGEAALRHGVEPAAAEQAGIGGERAGARGRRTGDAAACPRPCRRGPTARCRCRRARRSTGPLRPKMCMRCWASRISAAIGAGSRPTKNGATSFSQRDRGAGGGAVAEGLAPALEPFVGADADQHHGEPRGRASGDEVEAARGAVGNEEVEAVDRDYLHCAAPAAFTKGQPVSFSGRQAWSAGVVETSL